MHDLIPGVGGAGGWKEICVENLHLSNDCTLEEGDLILFLDKSPVDVSNAASDQPYLVCYRGLHHAEEATVVHYHSSLLLVNHMSCPLVDCLIALFLILHEQ